MENNFTIYKLSNYNVSKNEDGEFNCDSYTGTIDKVIKKLEKDKGYHLRINPDKDCIVFGDLDHIPSENIFNDFIKRISIIFDVDITNISHTLSIKENELSYHWSIPSIESNPRTIKTILEGNNFISFKDYIDLSIYSVKWFRLPEQSNKNKPLKHKIINGKPSDFIFEYINNTTDEIKYNFKDKEIKPKEKNKTDFNIEEEVLNCLECLNINDYNNYEQWCNIALIINNELGYNGLDILNNWSSDGEGYDKNKVEQFYKNIKPKENGLKIGSLKKMAK